MLGYFIHFVSILIVVCILESTIPLYSLCLHAVTRIRFSVFCQSFRFMYYLIYCITFFRCIQNKQKIIAISFCDIDSYSGFALHPITLISLCKHQPTNSVRLLIFVWDLLIAGVARLNVYCKQGKPVTPF